MISQELMQIVYQIRLLNDCGACFSVSFDNRNFLITAKHIIANYYQNNMSTQNSPILEIFTEQGWESLSYSRILFSTNPYLDIVAIEIIDNQNIIFQVFSYTANGINLGGDIFFLGYPYGYTNTDVQGVPRTLPLIKKAIISGTAYDKEGHFIGFLLDGHNNRGFSGGPCISITPIYQNQKILRYKNQIFGVTSSYIQDKNILFDEHGTPIIIFENSGLFTCHSIDLILEAIREN